MRTLLFHRRVEGYTGGHGKVLDYLRHATAHPGWRGRVYVAEGSLETSENPFARLGQRVPTWHPQDADALLLGGHDWRALPPGVTPPVIHLVQGVRHADPDAGLRPYLGRRAVRICVSRAVADAIQATGEVRGPCTVISAGVDTIALAEIGATPPTVDVLIDATKQPRLGTEVADRLREAGLITALHVDRLPRSAYLRQMASARVVVTLPFAEEGFYLPGLEVMAMGRALVQYDCLGSRDYLQDGRNARVTPADSEALAAAALALCRDPLACAALAERARDDARAFDLARERTRFHAVLDDLDALWEAAQ